MMLPNSNVGIYSSFNADAVLSMHVIGAASCFCKASGTGRS